MKELLLVPLFLLLPLIAHAENFQSGLEAYLRGDHAKALSEFIPLAEQGHDKAQGMLGAMYAKGLGVPQDDRRAEIWDRKAADQGIPGALDMLGLCYYRGEGVVRDRKSVV